MTRFALFFPLLVLSACGEPPPPAAPPGAVEKTITKLEAKEKAEKQQAVAVSRAREENRLEAAEERLEQAE